MVSKRRAVEWDPDSVPSRLIGLDINILTIKDAQAGMAQSDARLRSLFMMAPLPLVEIAADGRIAEVNARCIQTLGYGVDEIPTVDVFLSVAFPDSDSPEGAPRKQQQREPYGSGSRCMDTPIRF